VVWPKLPVDEVELMAGGTLSTVLEIVKLLLLGTRRVEGACSLVSSGLALNLVSEAVPLWRLVSVVIYNCAEEFQPWYEEAPCIKDWDATTEVVLTKIVTIDAVSREGLMIFCEFETEGGLSTVV
jgi:hypothetical protein